MQDKRITMLVTHEAHASLKALSKSLGVSQMDTLAVILESLKPTGELCDSLLPHFKRQLEITKEREQKRSDLLKKLAEMDSDTLERMLNGK